MSVLLIRGDARQIPLADKSVHCCVTSPPYWGLRDYGTPGQLGLETTPDEYLTVMVDVFREVWRVLREDGTLWLNMGDCYATGAGKVGECPGGGERGEKWKGYRDDSKGRGTSKRCDGRGGHVYYGPMTQPNRMPIDGLKAKDLVGMPWRLAFALQADGWWLRSDIIWSKPNPMPESVTDRPTKSHEYIFLLTKSERYYYNQEAILEPVSLGTHLRLSQNVQDQIGSERAHAGAKSNGNMKAVGRRLTFSERDTSRASQRRPKAWDMDQGSNRTLISRYPRKAVPETQARLGAYRDNQRKLAAAGSGTKNNESFDVAMAVMPMERNKRTVWEVNTQSFAEAHFATFPEELIKPCILAGCPTGGIVFDPFIGSGTTALVARNLQCNAIGLELNAEYLKIAKRRLSQEVFDFSAAAKVESVIEK